MLKAGQTSFSTLGRRTFKLPTVASRPQLLLLQLSQAATDLQAGVPRVAVQDWVLVLQEVLPSPTALADASE